MFDMYMFCGNLCLLCIWLNMFMFCLFSRGGKLWFLDSQTLAGKGMKNSYTPTSSYHFLKSFCNFMFCYVYVLLCLCYVLLRFVMFLFCYAYVCYVHVLLCFLSLCLYLLMFMFCYVYVYVSLCLCFVVFIYCFVMYWFTMYCFVYVLFVMYCVISRMTQCDPERNKE